MFLAVAGLRTGPKAVAYHFGFGPLQDTVSAQVAAALGSFSAQQVASTRLAVFGLPICRHFEPLFHTLVCFLFGHGTCPLGMCLSSRLPEARDYSE